MWAMLQKSFREMVHWGLIQGSVWPHGTVERERVAQTMERTYKNFSGVKKCPSFLVSWFSAVTWLHLLINPGEFRFLVHYWRYFKYRYENSCSLCYYNHKYYVNRAHASLWLKGCTAVFISPFNNFLICIKRLQEPIKKC